MVTAPCELTVDNISEWAYSVPITVERFNGTDDELRGEAIENAYAQREAYEARCSNRGEFYNHDWEPHEERAITSFLRHHYTNYDGLLEDLEDLEEDEDDTDELWSDFFDDRREAYETIRNRVHEELEKVYPQYSFFEF